MNPLRIVVDRDGVKRSGDYNHKLGGHPAGIPAKGRPVCGNCGASLLLLFQLDCSDPLLESYRFPWPYFFIFDCEGCQTTWNPMYYQILDDRVVVIHQEKADSWKLERAILPEMPVHLVALSKEQAASARSHYQRDCGSGKCHLMGVTPVWIQGSARPTCIRCQKKMKSIVQLDSDGRGDPRDPLLMFGDLGSFYVHWCRSCNALAVVQQCY